MTGSRAALAILALGCGGSHGAPGDAAGGDAPIELDAPGGLRCPSETALVADRTSCPGAIVVPPASLLDGAAALGDIVPLDGLAEGALPCAPAVVCAPVGAATMIFSDDPESPASDGVLYADTVGPGRVRVYVYHANGGASARKFPVVALNQGDADAHAQLAKAAVGAPSADYLAEGKAVAAAWLASSRHDTVTVPPHARVLLDPQLDAAHAAPGQLVHAIYDLDLDAPVKLSIVSVPASADAAAVTAGLSLLPADGLHDRGTFAGADEWIAAAVGGEGPSARHLRLGADVTEPDLRGTDATTGAPARLRGNYGVTVRLLATRRARVLASERGGAWEGAAQLGPITSPLPTADGALASTTDAVWLGDANDLAILSGGSSSLPVDLVILSRD